MEMNRKKALTQRYGTIGWQEFLRQKKDILSNYDSAKEMNSNRPVQTEHGNVAEASYRKWLSEYLPKKYGVTSGFIIPDVRSLDYKLNHYDVIIYDAINSPILWGSDNPDNTSQGRSRAIPAEHVHAVFEVKSSFTKTSITESINKLKELNRMKGHLNKYFSSGSVFFELHAKDQKTCKLAEDLYDDGVFGYFGGMILRAEGFDPNITGYYQFIRNGPETIDGMPLIRDIGDMEINNDGNPILTRQGDMAEAIAKDNVWHFNKGYSPVIKNVSLTWSYNNFPQFFIDMLDRLQGTFNPAKGSKQGSYGMSFLK